MSIYVLSIHRNYRDSIDVEFESIRHCGIAHGEKLNIARHLIDFTSMVSVSSWRYPKVSHAIPMILWCIWCIDSSTHTNQKLNDSSTNTQNGTRPAPMRPARRRGRAKVREVRRVASCQPPATSGSPQIGTRPGQESEPKISAVSVFSFSPMMLQHTVSSADSGTTAASKVWLMNWTSQLHAGSEISTACKDLICSEHVYTGCLYTFQASSGEQAQIMSDPFGAASAAVLHKVSAPRYLAMVQIWLGMGLFCFATAR